MKIVVLTNRGSVYGKKLINELLHNNISIEAVVVIRQPLGYYLKLFNYVKKRVGYIDAIYFILKKFISPQETISKWRNRKFITRYEEMNLHIIHTNGTNSPQTTACLTNLKPDLLLLGQTGIIRKHIIQIPQTGVLNSHPGILPHYRGIDCGKWAIYNGDYENVGCTVHWVDSGVDTGKIILKEKYILQNDPTIPTLEDHLDNHAVRLLVNVVSSIINKEKLPLVDQTSLEGKQYFKMSRRQEQIVSGILSERARLP